MVPKFKFFRGYIGTLGIMNEQTYATASLTDGQRFVEALYNYHHPRLDLNQRDIDLNEHDRRLEQMRNHGRITHEQYILNRDRLLLEERIRRQHMVEHVRGEETALRLFQATTVTTVNPPFKTKVKIFGTQVKLLFSETWRYDPIGVVVVTLLTSIVTFIGIAKLFGA